MRRIALIVTVPLLLGAGPCSNKSPTSGSIAGEGVVHRGVGPECPQTWHIATANGEIYWPLENPAFQQEGLRVRFSIRPRTEMASICMAGTMVEVISVEKL